MKRPYNFIPLPIDPSERFPEGSIRYYPLLTIGLVCTDGKKRNFKALIDSGADSCLLSIDIAKIIGLRKYKNSNWEYTTGIRGKRTKVYFHSIQYIYEGKRIDCEFGVIDSKERQSLIILGKEGFFDKFNITFDYSSKKYYIE